MSAVDAVDEFFDDGGGGGSGGLVPVPTPPKPLVRFHVPDTAAAAAAPPPRVIAPKEEESDGGVSVSSDTAIKRARRKSKRARTAYTPEEQSMRLEKMNNTINEAVNDIRARTQIARVVGEKPANLKTFRDLHAAHPPELNGVAPSGMAPQTESIKGAPGLRDSLQKMMAYLPAVSVHLTESPNGDSITPEQLKARLEEGAISTPCVGVSHVEANLVIGSPVCMNGDECYATRAPICRDRVGWGWKPRPLRAYLTADQLQNIGSLPTTLSRPCLLCMVYRFNLKVHLTRALDPACLKEELPLVAPFRVLVNTKDGFLECYTIKHDPTRWEGFLDRYLLLDTSAYKWSKRDRLPTAAAAVAEEPEYHIDIKACAWQDGDRNSADDVFLSRPKTTRVCARIPAVNMFSATNSVQISKCEFCYRHAPEVTTYVWFNRVTSCVVCNDCYQRKVSGDFGWCYKEQLITCPKVHYVCDNEKAIRQARLELDVVKPENMQWGSFRTLAEAQKASDPKVVAFFAKKFDAFIASTTRRDALYAFSSAAPDTAAAAAAASEPTLPPPPPPPPQPPKRVPPPPPITKKKLSAREAANHKMLSSITGSTILTAPPKASAAAAPSLAAAATEKFWACGVCKEKVSVFRPLKCPRCNAPRGAGGGSTAATPPPPPPRPLPNFHNESGGLPLLSQSSVHKIETAKVRDNSTLRSILATDPHIAKLEQFHRSQLRVNLKKSKRKPDRRTDRQSAIQANNSLYAFEECAMRQRRDSGCYAESLLSLLDTVSETNLPSLIPFKKLEWLPKIIQPFRYSAKATNAESRENELLPFLVECSRVFFCHTDLVDAFARVTAMCSWWADGNTPGKTKEEEVASDLKFESHVKEYSSRLSELPLHDHVHMLRWSVLNSLRSAIGETKESDRHIVGGRLLYFTHMLFDAYWFLPYRAHALLSPSLSSKKDLFSSHSNQINIHTQSTDVINEMTILNMRVISGAFYKDPDEVKKIPIEQLAAKSAPIKSAGRMFETVNTRIARFDYRFRDYQISLLIASLCGNYSHLPMSHHPSVPMRYHLYRQWSAIRGNPDAPWTFFYWLISNVSQAVKHSMQQYMCFRLRSMSFMVDHFKERKLFDFDEFSNGADALISDLRWKLEESRSRLFTLRSDTTFVSPEFVQSMLTFCSFYQKSSEIFMGNIIYPRKKFAFLKACKACVKTLPSTNIVDLIPGAFPTAVTKEEFAGLRREDSSSDFGLLSVVFESMWAFVKAADANERMPERFLPVLMKEYWGCPPDAVGQVSELMFTHYNGGKINVHCAALRNEFPHTYNVLQAYATFWQRRQIVRVHELPLHYHEAQRAALDYRVKTYVPGARDEQAFEHGTVGLCKTCLRIVTYVRDSGPFAKRAVQKGYLNSRVLLSPLDGTIRQFCSDQKVFQTEGCIHTEVITLPLLGHALEYRGQVVTLCPFPTCGVPFVVHPNWCHYTCDGYVCTDCTLVIMGIGRNAQARATGVSAEMPILQQHAADPRLGKQGLCDDSEDEDIDDDDDDEDDDDGGGPEGTNSKAKRTKSVFKNRGGVDIICQVCIKPHAIVSSRKLIASPYGFNACTSHDLDGMVEAVALVKLEIKANPECEGCLDVCKCDDLKTTCDGTINKASVIAVARMVSQNNKKLKAMRAQAKQLDRVVQQAILSGNRKRRRAPTSNKNK